MARQRLTTTLIYILLTAFLVVKWTPSHAHLNAQHDHGNERHQHSVETHSHQVVFHADKIETEHLQVGEDMVVDLDHDQSPQNTKNLDVPFDALVTFANYLPLIQTRELDLPDGHNFLPRPLHQHPGQPRAPPLST